MIFLSFIRAIGRFFYSSLVWVYMLFAFLGHRIVSLICLPFISRKREGVFFLAVPFLRVGFWILGVRLRVSGLDNLPKKGAFILVSNHQSLVDVLAYMVALPCYFSYFAKKELGKIPLLGWDIKHMGHYLVDRDDPKVALKQMEGVRQGLLSGRPLLVFPEGTRTDDGSVRSFKRGTFMLAVQTGVPVIPCVIEGAHEVLSKKSLVIRPGVVHVKVGRPIEVPFESNKAAQKAQAVDLMTQVYDNVNVLKDSLHS